MDDRLLDMVAFKKLEKMPTKIELIATIARLLNQVFRCCSIKHASLYCLHVNCSWFKHSVEHYGWSCCGRVAFCQTGLTRVFSLCRSPPSLQSASNKCLPSLRMVSRRLLTVMKTRRLWSLTSFPSQQLLHLSKPAFTA